MIKRETIENILEHAQIEDVVGRYVNLKRKGANLWGVCPFHEEKTPSFSVSPQKGFFKCFGCGKGGDAIAFIKEIEHIDYVGAVRKLGEMYGIKVEERKLTEEEQRKQNDRESMMVLNEYAMQWFEEQLWESDEGSAKGLSYIVGKRGINEKTLREFNIGYCPTGDSAFTNAALEAGYKEEFLLKTGLSAKDKTTSKIYDTFSGRIMFPIQNRAGKVVAFCGLEVENDDPNNAYKIISDNDIFIKDSNIYGIFQAARSIGKTNALHLVEGIMDVLALHQSGLENIVASGNALLTSEQVLAIAKNTHNVTLTLCGKNNSETTRLNINLMLKNGIRVNVVQLAEDDNAAQFVSRHNSEDVLKHFETQAVNCIEYLSQVLIRKAGDDINKKIIAIKIAAESIAYISDKMVQEMYAKKCAQNLNYDYTAFRVEIENAKGQITEPPKEQAKGQSVGKQAGYSKEKQYAKDQHQQPQQPDKATASDSKIATMLRLNEFAMKWFEHQLWNTDMGKSIGLSYIMGKRGMSEQTVREYHIGYCPNSWSAFSDAALKAGFTEEALIATGLSIKQEDKGQLYDRFRGRIIFPSHDIDGKIAGFGGRIMFEDKEKKFAKYVNSSDSDIFHKKDQLYGIYQACDTIKAKDSVYLVEGYLDVMSSHQVGIGNVVASSGTSLTENQVKLISSLTHNVYVLYDGDAAGIHATQRGIGMLLAARMNVKALCLPDNDDPDSFSKKHEAEYVIHYFEEEPVDGIDYLVNILLDSAGNNIDKRVEAVKSIATTISFMPDKDARAKCASQYAPKLDIDTENFIAEIEQQFQQRETGSDGLQQAKSDSKVIGKPEQPQPHVNSAEIAEMQSSEAMLTKCLLRHGDEILYTDQNGKIFKCGEYLLEGLKTWKVSFITIIYNKIVDEYRQHHNDSDFNIISFFSNHDDGEVKKAAENLLKQRDKTSKIFGKISISENMVVQSNNEKIEVEAQQLPIILKEYLLRRVAYDRKQGQKRIKLLYDKQSELTNFLKNTEIMEVEEEQKIRQRIDDLSENINKLWQWDDMLRKKESDIKQSLNWVI